MVPDAAGRFRLCIAGLAARLKDNVGFKCLEHGIVHDTQSIFYPIQANAHRFIAEFGRLAVPWAQIAPGHPLGPSGDFSGQCPG